MFIQIVTRISLRSPDLPITDYKNNTERKRIEKMLEYNCNWSGKSMTIVDVVTNMLNSIASQLLYVSKNGLFVCVIIVELYDNGLLIAVWSFRCVPLILPL